jgi:hypothetical protein
LLEFGFLVVDALLGLLEELDLLFELFLKEFDFFLEGFFVIG